MTTNTDLHVAMPELPCPFCGGKPTTIERPDNIDGTEFVYAVACYCGGHSATAHKIARRKTPEQAKADAIAAWNRRAAIQAAVPEGLADLLLSCRGSVKADLERYEVLILGCNYNETIAFLEVEANRLRVLLDSIDALDASPAPSKANT